MSYTCLADFLEELGRSGQLARIDATVDPVLEVAEIARQAARSTDAALLFSSPGSGQMPLLVGALGIESRVCRALGVTSLDEVAARLDALVDAPEAEGWFERLKSVPTRTLLAKLAPRTVKMGRCQQVVLLGRDVDLERLPAPRVWPDEPRRTITAGQFHTVDPRSGRRLVGRFDLEILDAARLAVHWAPHETSERLLDEYVARGESMPVAIVLGGDPAGLLAAMAPLPPTVDAVALAGLLRDRVVELVAGRTTTMAVPADAEIIIEGVIDPAAPRVASGPICTPLGHYAPEAPCPVIEVTALTHCANPVFPALLHGPPPNELVTIHRAMRRVLLPMVRLGIPELVDYEFPEHGGGRQVAWVSIRKTHVGQARRVAQAFWGMPAMMFAKLLVIVDDGVDVHDSSQVGAAVAAHCDPGRDVSVNQGPPDPWDAASPHGVPSQRLAIDATTKLPGETASPRRPVRPSDEWHQLVRARWAEFGLGGK